VDNCHSLVETKLLRDRRWEFTNTLPLNDLDSWLSIGYDQPKMDISVCCTRFSLKTRTVPLDPLGDGVIASAAVHSEPRISVLRTPMASETYQRTSRHYVAMIDQRFTLAMFDASANRVHWLVVDIPSASLAAGALDDGDEILPYLPPIPPSPADCRSYVFLLFLQTASQSSSATSNGGGTKVVDHFPGEHMYRSRFCRGDCLQRNDFNPQSLAARHRLRLSAVNWMSTCYDAFEAHRQIRISRANSNATVIPPVEEEPEIRAEKWAVIPPTVEQLGPEAQICLAMNLTVVDQNCPDCAFRNHFTLCNLWLLPLFLLWRNWM